MTTDIVAIVDKMYTAHGESDPLVRISRAHIHGIVKTGPAWQLIPECHNFIGRLRGYYKAHHREYAAQHLDTKLLELLNLYKVAHDLVHAAS